MYDIFITAIGGDHIDFYIFTKNLKEEIAEGVVRLTFDDGSKVVLSGIIILHESIYDRTIFRLKYVGTAYKDMKTVYAQLFRKQIQLRNILGRLVR